jgi:hypothetical protein
MGCEMAKERVIRQMTEVQRQKILQTPGVIVRSWNPSGHVETWKPRTEPERKLSVTASELIDDVGNEWLEELTQR